MSESPNPDPILDSLAGRTIVRGLWDDYSACWIWLDDSRIIEFRAHWCNDSTADGELSEIETIDVARCHHCGQPHPDRKLYRRVNGNGYAYCIDGNHMAIIPDLPRGTMTEPTTDDVNVIAGDEDDMPTATVHLDPDGHLEGVTVASEQIDRPWALQITDGADRWLCVELDGTVTTGPGVELNDMARRFWQAVTELAPDRPDSDDDKVWDFARPDPPRSEQRWCRRCTNPIVENADGSFTHSAGEVGLGHIPDPLPAGVDPLAMGTNGDD